jgi:hypothetical protein
MECDIHLFVEKRENGKWRRMHPPPEARDPDYAEDADKEGADAWVMKYAETAWFTDRNYNAFGILANVRNGTGFANISTGGGFIPIAEPRGWPTDLSPELEKLIYQSEREDDENEEVDIGVMPGDHSESWVTLAELLAYNWDRYARKTGVLDLVTYAEWRETGCVGQPKQWCGGISGPNVVTLDEAKYLAASVGAYDDEHQGLGMPKVLRLPDGKEIHVRCCWSVSYKEAAGGLYSRLIPELQKLAGDGPAEDVRIVFNFDS